MGGAIFGDKEIECCQDSLWLCLDVFYIRRLDVQNQPIHYYSPNPIIHVILSFGHSSPDCHGISGTAGLTGHQGGGTALRAKNAGGSSCQPGSHFTTCSREAATETSCENGFYGQPVTSLFHKQDFSSSRAHCPRSSIQRAALEAATAKYGRTVSLGSPALDDGVAITGSHNHIIIANSLTTLPRHNVYSRAHHESVLGPG